MRKIELIFLNNPIEVGELVTLKPALCIKKSIPS